MGADEPPVKKAKAGDLDKENVVNREVKAEKDKENNEKKDKKDRKDKKEKRVDKDKDKKHKKDKKERKDKKTKKDKKNKRSSKARAKLKVKKGFMAKAKKSQAKSKAPAQPKALRKTEDDYEPVNRWWEREDGALSGKRGAKKWDTFEHHGLMFAPEYEPHGVGIKYDGVDVKLDVDAEEIATFWVSVKGTPYETKDIFIKNFWDVFQSVLPKDTIIKDMSKCDFSAIAEHRENERQARLNRNKEEKEGISAKNKEDCEYFSYALVNGIRERLGAFRLEPPQLFRGRGEHPKQGMLKKRTYTENITLNLAADAPVPRSTQGPGRAWNDVVHENTVQWIASFHDGLLDETKYVSFAATSGLKGQPDMLKYDRARRLIKVIEKIREGYVKLQTSKNLIDRQKATAMYFIDKLALRVGGEKNEEEEADTVGCCSLRVEHVHLEPPNTAHFDFLGKDSIQYKNSVKVTDQVFANLVQFRQGKKPEDNIFDKVDPKIVNDYFKEFMEDLSAKVFRTYNASWTLQQELGKFDMKQRHMYTDDQMVKFYNDANREVAILCNHQKAVSKQHDEGMEKMQKVKDTMIKNVRILKKHLVNLESKPDDKQVKSGDGKLPKDTTSCQKRIAETKLRLDKHNSAMQLKEENKTVSLGTSKVNYMDPRISVAWCKKVDLPIEKVFPRTVRTKFPWAMHFKSAYLFD